MLLKANSNVTNETTKMTNWRQRETNNKTVRKICQQELDVEYSNSRLTQRWRRKQKQINSSPSILPTTQHYTEHTNIIGLRRKTLESLVEIDVGEILRRMFRQRYLLVVKYHPLVTAQDVTDIVTALGRCSHVTDEGHESIFYTQTINIGTVITNITRYISQHVTSHSSGFTAVVQLQWTESVQ